MRAMYIIFKIFKKKKRNKKITKKKKETKKLQKKSKNYTKYTCVEERDVEHRGT